MPIFRSGIICKKMERSKFSKGVDFLKFGALQIFVNDRVLFTLKRYKIVSDCRVAVYALPSVSVLLSS